MSNGHGVSRGGCNWNAALNRLRELPIALEVSMPWSSTTMSTLCSCRFLDKAIWCSRERPSRSAS
jgi:hypothetical protein